MDKTVALRIIQSLADGIDPSTGEILPDCSPYQNPQIIRALFAAIQSLQIDCGVQERHEQDLPGNAGKPWDVEEDKQLLRDFDAGVTINQLAHRHQRTTGAIRSRLEKLGKLNPSTATIDN